MNENIDFAYHISKWRTKLMQNWIHLRFWTWISIMVLQQLSYRSELVVWIIILMKHDILKVLSINNDYMWTAIFFCSIIYRFTFLITMLIIWKDLMNPKSSWQKLVSRYIDCNDTLILSCIIKRIFSDLW